MTMRELEHKQPIERMQVPGTLWGKGCWDSPCVRQHAARNADGSYTILFDSTNKPLSAERSPCE